VSTREYSLRFRVSTAFERHPLRLIFLLGERERVTRMRINSIQRIAVLFVALAMTVPVFAKPFTQTINLTQTAKVGFALGGSTSVLVRGKRLGEGSSIYAVL
jgi:hypothetical protein